MTKMLIISIDFFLKNEGKVIKFKIEIQQVQNSEKMH